MVVLERGQAAEATSPVCVGQHATVDVRGPQRFGRSTRSGERPHAAAARWLAEAIFGDAGAGDLDRLAEVAGREGQLGVEVGGGEPLLVQRLAATPASGVDVGELLERPAVPQAAGLTDDGQAAAGVGSVHVRRAASISVGGSGGVELAGLEPQPVAAGPGLQPRSPPARGAVATERRGSGGRASPKPPRSSGHTAATRLSTLTGPGAAIASRASTARRFGPGTATSTPVDDEAQRSEHPDLDAPSTAPADHVSSNTRSGRRQRAQRALARAPTRPSPAGSRSRTTSAVASDTSTWPPAASAISRAARFRAGPK